MTKRGERLLIFGEDKMTKMTRKVSTFSLPALTTQKLPPREMRGCARLLWSSSFETYMHQPLDFEF